MGMNLSASTWTWEIIHAIAIIVVSVGLFALLMIRLKPFAHSRRIRPMRHHLWMAVTAALVIVATVLLGIWHRTPEADSLPDLVRTESSRTYYLENPTGQETIENVLSITLHRNGTVQLGTSPSLSIVLSQCTYSIAGDTLLINRTLEFGMNELFVGPSNDWEIARFEIVNANILVCRSAEVSLFAKVGARYLYAPFS